MTRQSSERLIYKGQEYGIVTQPLDSFRMKMEKNPILFPPDTACWRGYRGTWEVRENKLFLIKLKAYTANHGIHGVELFFPGQKEVFAEWFTGEIQAPYGETGEVMQTMYQSIYGKDLFLDIREGVLVGARVVVNKNPFDVQSKAEETTEEIIVPKKKSFWERLIGRQE